MRRLRRREWRVLGMCVLAALATIAVDAGTGEASPFEPIRAVVGGVVGPAESATTAAVRPFTDLADTLRTNQSLRSDVAELTAQNAQLQGQVATSELERQRLAELEGLTELAGDTGYALVAARVVAMGPMQSFTRTVTIDAGISSGIRADMTVLNNDGLVGRVVRADRSTATVLLAIDKESVIGGRLGTNLEIGFLRGRGTLGERGRLDLELVDNSVAPSRGDVVVTWGSEGGVPYVAGIPVGTVESVVTSPRETSRKAVIRPLVDFSALDVVGVVVPADTEGDRPLITGSVD